MANAERLVKNTLYMYVRMFFIMLVSIYSSRIILDKLGVDDYGLYNAISSVVAIMAFLNVTLSTSTSRFITFDIGVGDYNKLRQTFSTAFYSHLFLACFVLVLMETLGVLYMNTAFIIPEGRELEVKIVYHLSIISTIFAIIQVPYMAAIMAHEDMHLYAFIGVFEVIAKLSVIYLLNISTIDNMVFYSILIAIVQLIVTLFFIFIAKYKYEETRLTSHFNFDTFRAMIGFTGWTAIANLSNSIVVQGGILLLNLFFSPAVIAAKALANQITNAVMQFVNNFRLALNPQVIKLYSSGNFDSFKVFTLRSTVISFDLMLILGLPCVFTMKTILGIWLIEVPEGTVKFTQLAILAQIINVISSSTYIPFVASGKLKFNAILATISSVGYFIALYIIFKIGGKAIWVQWAYIVLCLFSVLILRPYLLNKELGFSLKELLICGWMCLRTLIVAGGVSLFLNYIFNDTLLHQILLFLTILLVTIITAYIFMEQHIRDYLTYMIKSKISSYIKTV